MRLAIYCFVLIVTGLCTSVAYAQRCADLGEYSLCSNTRVCEWCDAQGCVDKGTCPTDTTRTSSPTSTTNYVDTSTTSRQTSRATSTTGFVPGSSTTDASLTTGMIIRPTSRITTSTTGSIPSSSTAGSIPSSSTSGSIPSGACPGPLLNLPGECNSPNWISDGDVHLQAETLTIPSGFTMHVTGNLWLDGDNRITIRSNGAIVVRGNCTISPSDLLIATLNRDGHSTFRIFNTLRLNGRLQVNSDENFYPEHNEVAALIHFSASEGEFTSVEVDSNEQECKEVKAEGRKNQRDFSVLFSVQDNGSCDEESDDSMQWIIIIVVCVVVAAAVAIGLGVCIVNKVRSV